MSALLPYDATLDPLGEREGCPRIGTEPTAVYRERLINHLLVRRHQLDEVLAALFEEPR